MRIHGLCVLKNEIDVVRQSLPAAAAWADCVYVLDNGSDDGTWEAVLELAERFPAIVPHGRDTRRFSSTMRRELFDAHRSSSREGDWWGTVDADEFYIDDPRAFLASLPGEVDEVWSASFEYYFTDVDAARYREDPSSYADDVPVAQKLRFYLNNWSEPRFFRDRRGLDWNDGSWPDLRRPASARIRLKHFQYRSPEQIQRRLDDRRKALGGGAFRHEGLPDWHSAVLNPLDVDFSESGVEHVPALWSDRVLDASLLVEDTGSDPYVVDEAALPPIERPANRGRRLLRRFR